MTKAVSVPSVNEMIEANVNPRTGLATDYLNLFNEAIMLFEMAFDMPDMLEELAAWKRRSYVEHFRASGFQKSETVVAAYEAADPHLRRRFDILCEQTCDAFERAISRLGKADLTAPEDSHAAKDMLDNLKERVSMLDAEIHGGAAGPSPAEVTDAAGASQAEIDSLF